MKLSDHIQMRSSGRSLVALMAVVGVAVLGGCGSSHSRSTSVAKSAGTTSQPTPTQTTTSAPNTTSSTHTSTSVSPPVDAIELRIPVLLPKRFIPARYTCDGGDLSIPLHWEEVPHGTAELALFILDERRGESSVDWAVAGLSPALSGLAAGRLPAGAVVGRNSFGQDGYSTCPERGQEQIYIVALFALPHRLPLGPGFDAEALHQQVERLARVQGVTSYRYTRA